MKANKVDLFQKYWRIVKPLSPMFHEEGKFSETITDQNDKLLGTKLEGSGKNQGIVRIVMANGNLQEFSVKEDSPHGLMVHLSDREYFVGFYKLGKFMAQLCFDDNFKETKRSDPQHYLDDLSPDSFKR